MDEKEIIQQKWNEINKKHMLEHLHKLYVQHGLEKPKKDRKHEAWLLLIPVSILMYLLWISS